MDTETITYWRIMPRGNIKKVTVTGNFNPKFQNIGLFEDEKGGTHLVSQHSPDFNSAYNEVIRRLTKQEANAKASLLSVQMRRIRLEESLALHQKQGNEGS